MRPWSFAVASPCRRRSSMCASFAFAALAAFAASARADHEPGHDPGTPAEPETPDTLRRHDVSPEWWPFPAHGFRTYGEGLNFRIGAYASYDVIRRGRRNEEDELRSGCTDLRPTIEAWDDDLDLTFRVEGDAVGVDTPRNLYEAWASWSPDRALRITAGQFRLALGTEYGTHESDLPYVGYGFTSQLTGRHDVGLRVDGSPYEGFWYQAAGLVGQGFNLEGDRLESRQGSLRLAVAPFALGDREARSAGGLSGFRVGGAYALQRDVEDPLHATTPVGTTVIRTADLDADRARWVGVDAGWSSGPFQIGFEKMLGRYHDVPVPGGGEMDFDHVNAYSWFASWNLTGEETGWRDGTWEKGPCHGPRSCDFLPPGRWELSGRFSAGTFGRRDIVNSGLATRSRVVTVGGPATWQAHTYSAALFWEPAPGARIGLEVVKTVTEDPLIEFGDTKRDTAFVLRFELLF